MLIPSAMMAAFWHGVACHTPILSAMMAELQHGIGIMRCVHPP